MKLLITHNDLDGLGCARALKVHTDYTEFVDYSIKQDLLPRFGRLYQPEQTIIADVSITPDDGNILDESLGKVTFIDHHPNCGVKPNDRIKVIYNDSGQVCATDLCYSFINKPADDWCEIVHDYDLWIREKPESTKMAGLVTLLGTQFMMQYTHFDIKTLLARPFMQRALVEVDKAIQESIQLAEDTRIDCNVNGIPLTVCAIQGFSSQVGNKLSEKDNSVVVMLNITSANSISFTTTRDDVNLTEIANIMGGGGHPKAAGCPLPLDSMLPMLQALVSTIMEGYDDTTDNS